MPRQPESRDDRVNRILRDMLHASRKVVDAAEDLKKAQAALSLEASRPALKIATEGTEEVHARAQ